MPNVPTAPPTQPIGLGMIGVSHQVFKVWLSVGAIPVLYASILQSGMVGTAYSETLSVSGGASPYTFSIQSGTIPTGTSLNSSTGVISGTPTSSGTFTFTAKVVDSGGLNSTQVFQIIVSAIPYTNYAVFD